MTNLHYFDRDAADTDDTQLAMAKRQGYVPSTCLLGGMIVLAEVAASRNPCWGCHGPREKCGGIKRKAMTKDIDKQTQGSDLYSPTVKRVVREFSRSLAQRRKANTERMTKIMGWQPIDTAPKDGTPVDLWFQSFQLADRDSDKLVPSIGFRVTNAIWFSSGWTNEDGNPIERIRDFDLTSAKFTHWMPIPAQP